MSEEQAGTAGPTPIVGKIAILLFGVAIGAGATLAAVRLDPAGAPGTVATASVDLESMIGRGQSFPSGGGGSQPAATSGLPTVESMVARLQERLKASPDDPEGWRMLGWSYLSLGRYHESVAAYREAANRAPGDAPTLSGLGEALVRQSGGTVTDEAADLFRQAAALDRGEARARFFLGLAKSQAGDPQGAIDDWVALVGEAPGAEYAAEIRSRITELAAANGIDLGDRLAAPQAPSGPSPTTEQVAAAEAMPAADRQAMIQGMVERLESRLAENPRDAEGWVRLIRSWSVLGDTAMAEQALVRAIEAFAAEPATRDSIVAQAAGLGVAPR